MVQYNSVLNSRTRKDAKVISCIDNIRNLLVDDKYLMF